MSAKILVLVISVKAIIFLLLYNLHDCTFNCFLNLMEIQTLNEELVPTWLKETRRLVMQ